MRSGREKEKVRSSRSGDMAAPPREGGGRETSRRGRKEKEYYDPRGGKEKRGRVRRGKRPSTSRGLSLSEKERRSAISWGKGRGGVTPFFTALEGEEKGGERGKLISPSGRILDYD